MKKIIAILFLLIAFWACEEKIDVYEGECGIYFDTKGAVLDTIVIPWGLENSDVTEQKLKLRVCLLGDVADYDRKFNLRVITEEGDPLHAVEGEDFRILEEEYAIPAGKAETLVEVQLLRAADLDKRARRFTLQLEETPELKFLYSRFWSLDSALWVGDERLRPIDYKRVIYMDERFKVPVWWDYENYGPRYFGTYSTKKCKFICDKMGIDRKDFVASLAESPLEANYLRWVGQYLHDYLREHPEYEDNGELMTMGSEFQE